MSAMDRYERQLEANDAAAVVLCALCTRPINGPVTSTGDRAYHQNCWETVFARLTVEARWEHHDREGKRLRRLLDSAHDERVRLQGQHGAARMANGRKRENRE